MRIRLARIGIRRNVDRFDTLADDDVPDVEDYVVPIGKAKVRREGKDVGYVDVIDRPRQHGVSNYGFFDRLWVGILDLAGVWWLIRRKKRVPESTEIS